MSVRIRLTRKKYQWLTMYKILKMTEKKMLIKLICPTTEVNLLDIHEYSKRYELSSN